jgi:hypothetical protein
VFASIRVSRTSVGASAASETVTVTGAPAPLREAADARLRESRERGGNLVVVKRLQPATARNPSDRTGPGGSFDMRQPY